MLPAIGSALLLLTGPLITVEAAATSGPALQLAFNLDSLLPLKAAVDLLASTRIRFGLSLGKRQQQRRSRQHDARGRRRGPVHDSSWNIDWPGIAGLPATNLGPDINWYTNITVGTPPQPFRVTVDSGSADLLLFSSTCPNCNLNNHSSFNAAKSRTYSNAGSVPFVNTYASGDVYVGKTGIDTVSLGSLKIKSQMLALTEDYQRVSAIDVYDGIMGIAPDANSFIPNTVTTFSNLVKNNQLLLPLMGIALVQAPSRSQGGGEYAVGWINPRYLGGPVIFTDVTSQYYWGVALTDIQIGGKSVMGANTPPRGLFDTGSTLVTTSDEAAAAIHARIQGAKQDSEGTWTVPCTGKGRTPPDLDFVIAGRKWTVPGRDIPFNTIRDGNTCLSGIQGGSENFTVLGNVFIRHIYLILNYGDASESKKTVGIAKRSGYIPKAPSFGLGLNVNVGVNVGGIGLGIGLGL